MIKSYLISISHRYASKWLVLAIDVAIIGVSFVLSYLVRFNLSFDFDVQMLLKQLPVVALLGLGAFLITGSYKSVIRHTGAKDIYNIFNAICLSSILMIFFVMIVRWGGFLTGFTIPLSIIIIHSLISFVILTASRYVFKTSYASLTSQFKRTKNILIYGAGQSGILTYNALSNHSYSSSKVVGFIDDDKKKIGKKINGVRVFDRRVLNDFFLAKNDIREIIFAIHNIEPTKLREMLDGLIEYPVKVKKVPPVEIWIDGEFKVSQIKQVQIEDLLNRTPIHIKKSKVSQQLSGKTIMVTGGAGSIGSEIVRQICKYDYHRLIIIDQAESALYDLQQELKQQGYHNFVPFVADVRDKKRMTQYFEEFSPDMVYHAAAYKHVPLMEYNAYEAVRINIQGTRNIADLAQDYGVEKFVFISTDKAVNPTNVMGATKRIAEMYISCKHQEGKTKFITTRFGNVLGSNGSVIPLFRKQIEKGGPLTVTHKDITRYFMTIPEASQLVLEAACMGKGGEIFLFDMGESVKIYELAKNMIKLSGLRYPEDIDIKITGLRPGEKLYEELLANGENTLPTYNEKIMISKVRELDYATIRKGIEDLCAANSIYFEPEKIVELMKGIVPEYISNNSSFSQLDKTKKSSNIGTNADSEPDTKPAPESSKT